MATGPLLEAWQVSKRFPLPGGSGELAVLEKVDLALDEGQVVALLGKSGSGKSTLLRILAGLIPASEGEVRYRGQLITGPCAGVAMVFQSFALLPWLDVLGNVELGTNPGHVRNDLQIDLSRPRTREDSDVQAFSDELYQLLTRPEAAREAPQPDGARAVLSPLPHARVGALAGFLEIVAERGGRVDLHRLAGELHLDVRELLSLVDAAALLGWVEVREGDALLTNDGHGFVEASVLARKELFRTALERRPTLVTRIHAALSGKANHRLPESFFLGLLEQHFSGAEARRQLDTAIDWGRYAELFGFEDDTSELFLDLPA